MSDIFFRELGISAPLYHLGVSGGTAGAMVGEMLPKLEALMLSIQPDAVLVYGDTNTTLAGALAAAQTGIPLFHVEAGLRSGNMRTPEEVNRVITDRLSALLLCPTQRAVTNLEAEGIVHNVFHVGDVMYDVSISTGAVASRQSLVGFDGLRPGEYAVATLHRAENVEDASRLELLLAYLEEQARIVPIVMPLHPRTRRALGGRYPSAGVIFTEPLGYLDLQRLLAGASCVYTDSGGLQKEAYFHRKPCVTLRDATEWTETIEAGWNRLWTQPEWLSPRWEIADYGEGRASEAIVCAIEEFF
jgi:UDP-GlcNAc3NAcA epimerase